MVHQVPACASGKVARKAPIAYWLNKGFEQNGRRYKTNGTSRTNRPDQTKSPDDHRWKRNDTPGVPRDTGGTDHEKRRAGQRNLWLYHHVAQSTGRYSTRLYRDDL